VGACWGSCACVFFDVFFFFFFVWHTSPPACIRLEVTPAVSLSFSSSSRIPLTTRRRAGGGISTFWSIHVGINQVHLFPLPLRRERYLSEKSVFLFELLGD